MGEAVPELPALDEVEPDMVGFEILPDFDDTDDEEE